MIGRRADTARHTMEEAFCRDVDNMLMDRLHIQADTEEAKLRLAKAAGLRDSQLVEELTTLGVTPEGLMAVQMIPLVLTAWANHAVDDREREFVMAQAVRFGVRERSEAHALLEHWLRHRPPVMVFDTWKRFIRHEFSSMCPKSRQQLIKLTKEQVAETARRSGGIWRFLRIGTNEQMVINSITRALDDCLKEADKHHSG